MSVRKIRERPVRRVYDAGDVVWTARVREGDRKISIGTYGRRADAQAAIDDWYDRGRYTRPETLGAYALTWTDRHPRSERTNRTNDHRISRVLDVRISGKKLRDWPLGELRRKHAHELVGHLLTDQGRATSGAANILRALSALAEDAITDELCEINPWRGVRVRSNDPRASKKRREPRVWAFDDMHRFADHAGQYMPLVRVLSDCGLRLGEALGLEHRDFDGQALHVRGNAHDGRFTPGDAPTKRHVRTVPVPPTLCELLAAVPRDMRTPLLFPTKTGKLYRERNLYRDIWYPAREAAGIDPTPHEFRHSYLSHMRAAGIDDADLAKIAGHSLMTMVGTYVHALGRSDDAVRDVIG